MLNWRRKGGCYRASTDGIQVKITKGADGKVELAVNCDGDWRHFPADDVEQAKAFALAAVEVGEEVLAKAAGRLEKRREDAVRLAATDPKLKAAINLFKRYRESEEARAYLRGVRPEMARQFDEIMEEATKAK